MTSAWCDTCSAYRPNAGSDSVCETCGDVVAPAPTSDQGHEERTVGQSAPWHFWVVVVALAAYLLWRAVVGVQWAIERF